MCMKIRFYFLLDVDECANSAANGCYDNSYCQNTVGSYTCTCPADFRLKGDGKTCECKITCKIMVFVFNSFEYIKIVFYPVDDFVFCLILAIFQCASNHGCNYTCGKINNVDTCSCPTGYQLDLSDNRTCIGKL